MGTPVAYPWAVGVGHAGFRVVLPFGGTGNFPFRVVNVGGNPLYGKYPGGVPPLGFEMDHGATSPEISRR